MSPESVLSIRMKSHAARIERDGGVLIDAVHVYIVTEDDPGRVGTWRGLFDAPLCEHPDPGTTCRLSLDDGRSGTILIRKATPRGHALSVPIEFEGKSLLA